MIENLLIASVLLLFSNYLVFWQQLSQDHLLITEVYYNTPGSDAGEEWIELANLGDQMIELSDHKLGDEESIWGGEGMVRFPQDSSIAPGQIIVVARSAVGFRSLYGRDPDFEIEDSIPQVPDMRRYALWSNGDIALANDGDEVLLLDDQNQLIDSINYGEKLTYFSPSIGDVFTGQSIERQPASCDSDTAADWQPQRNPTPGKVQLEGECSVIVEPDPNFMNLLSIGQIQGEDDVSPYINQVVEFKGIVTGSFEDQNADGIIFYTLFVQDIPGEQDGNPLTSDGIAIFLELSPPKYQPGDIVLVRGKVTEYFGLTEIDDDGLEIVLISRDSSLPAPEPLHPPANESASRAYFEALEGALVTLPFAARVVGPTHIGCGFAVLNKKSVEPPLPLRQIGEPPGPVLSILHNSDVDCQDIPQLKIGDNVAGLVGPLIYHFDLFKIVQQDMSALGVSISTMPKIPVVQQPSENQFSIASVNLENYFDEKRDTTNSAEPVFSEYELDVKRKKIAHTISDSLGCPTFVAVQEVENETLLQGLVEETADLCGFHYHISHRDGPDSRGLDVALLSDPRLAQIKVVAVQQRCTDLDTGIVDPNLTCPDEQSPLFGRPPLQVDVLINEQHYLLLVNHFKSKRGDEIDTQERRFKQATMVHELIGEILEKDPEAQVIVLGDMNDYELSPAMLHLTADGILYNALQDVPLEERYSYIFDGRTQLIDSILVSEQVKSQIARVGILHLNADYPVGLAKDVSLEGLHYRASDHDIPFLILNLPIEAGRSADLTPPPTPTHKTVPKEYPNPTPVQKAPKNNSDNFQPVVWLAIGGVILMTGTFLVARRKIPR